MATHYEMLMERNTGIPMRDGAVLRGDVFRPKDDGKFPVLMTFGPYGKDVPLREFMQEAWDAIEKFYPDIIANSSLKNLVWKTPDPESWVPDGYIVIRVDARGCGKSPGRLAPTRRKNSAISTTRSNGRACSPGATARSG